MSGLARSTFYYYLKHDNTDKYECEKQEIQNIFNANKGRYGYRRITVTMRNKGYVINHKTIQKLIPQLGWESREISLSKDVASWDWEDRKSVV